MKITRRALLLTALFASRSKASSVPDDLVERVRAFHLPWDQFLRSLYGCSRTAATTGECNSNQGAIDYGAFVKAGRAARKLFSL